MKKEVLIPENVNIELTNKKVKVSGPKGQQEKEFKHFFNIRIDREDNKIVVSSDSEAKKIKAMVGTIAAHVRNLAKGVTDGYTYKMRVVYTHFPMTVKTEGNKLIVTNFLGEKTLRTAKILGDTKVDVNGQDITLTGSNKENVAQTAGNIETATKISKKDRRVFQDGIYILKERG